MGKLVGERKAAAAAVLGFYMSIFFLASLQAPEGWAGAFGGLAGIYAMGFVGLVAGYFWARWFCIGLGISGLISAAMSIWQIGPDPVLVFYGATHALVSATLWGGNMASVFDGRTEWREKYHLDENATHRLGKSVIRVGVSLPYVVLYALAPREPASLLALLGAGLALGGLYGLVRMRTWSLAALGASAAAIGLSFIGGTTGSFEVAGFGFVFSLPLFVAGSLAFTALLTAMAPFARPVGQYLLRDRN